MGGVPPLGYKPHGRTLLVVEDHAELVRTIFERYLACGNVRLLVKSLEADGLIAPRRKAGTGRIHGGAALARGQLYAILRNPIYIGRIQHRGLQHKGQHAAIIDLELWNKVQAHLSGNVRGTRGAPSPSVSILAGRIVDAQGAPLIATHANKGGRRYRYYVSKALHHGERHAADDTMRIPAAEIEQVVAQECSALLKDPLHLVELASLNLAPAQFEMLLKRSKDCAAALGRIRRDLFITLQNKFAPRELEVLRPRTVVFPSHLEHGLGCLGAAIKGSLEGLPEKNLVK